MSYLPIGPKMLEDLAVSLLANETKNALKTESRFRKQLGKLTSTPTCTRVGFCGPWKPEAPGGGATEWGIHDQPTESPSSSVTVPGALARRRWGVSPGTRP